MILKPAPQGDLPADPRLRAGVKAERQMTYYLHREFADDPAVCVLHDLRLVDPEQPDFDGSPGVCQIDHLVVHRYGFFIVECKSILEAVRVTDDGTGHDEWQRVFKGKPTGMPSPIQQATRQAELLRKFLARHSEQLLGKMPFGVRTITKLLRGTDQRGFRFAPIQVIVAFADQASIERKGRWKPPEQPFRVFVSKADNVCSQIKEEIEQHGSSGKLMSQSETQYGQWSMKPDEVGIVAQFLAESHTPLKRGIAPTTPTTAPTVTASAAQPAPQARTPRSTRRTAPRPSVTTTVPTEEPTVAHPMPAAPTANTARCRHCNATALTGKWGRYGYYWSCQQCDGNTPMPLICEACGHEGKRGQGVKIRKDGDRYFRACEQCGVEHGFWVQVG